MSASRPRLVGDLDAEPDGDPERRPALGGLADGPLAVAVVGPVVRVGRVEVDVVGDRQLARSVARDGRGGVRVDRDVAVGRPVGVEMGVERQVARLGIERAIGQCHPAVRPVSRPIRSNAPSAVSSCSSVCAAVTIVRIRALSRATVG